MAMRNFLRPFRITTPVLKCNAGDLVKALCTEIHDFHFLQCVINSCSAQIN